MIHKIPSFQVEAFAFLRVRDGGTPWMKTDLMGRDTIHPLTGREEVQSWSGDRTSCR